MFTVLIDAILISFEPLLAAGFVGAPVSEEGPEIVGTWGDVERDVAQRMIAPGGIDAVS